VDFGRFWEVIVLFLRGPVTVIITVIVSGGKKRRRGGKEGRDEEVERNTTVMAYMLVECFS
jgi:hypothetical protein